MITTRFRRVAGHSALTLGLIISGSALLCNQGSGSGPSCPKDGNANWKNRGIDIVRTAPQDCPYTLARAGDTLHFALKVIGPANNVG